MYMAIRVSTLLQVVYQQYKMFDDEPISKHGREETEDVLLCK
jgi:hypothetical protein